MNRQPSLHDPAEGSAPLPQRFNFVTVEDAHAKAMQVSCTARTESICPIGTS